MHLDILDITDEGLSISRNVWLETKSPWQTISIEHIRDLFQSICNIHSNNTRSSASNKFFTQSFRTL